MSTNQLISLLDYLSYKAGCMYLSDLRTLDSAQCCMLKRRVEEIPAEQFAADEWQDALDYLASIQTDETDPDALKAQLIQAPWNCRQEVR